MGKIKTGRSACGNLPTGGTLTEAVPFLLRPRPYANQNRRTSPCDWRFDRLMVHMADRAGLGRKIGMMMPDLSIVVPITNARSAIGRTRRQIRFVFGTFEGTFRDLAYGVPSLAQL